MPIGEKRKMVIKSKRKFEISFRLIEVIMLIIVLLISYGGDISFSRYTAFWSVLYLLFIVLELLVDFRFFSDIYNG